MSHKRFYVLAAAVQEKVVPLTKGLPRYPIDDIMEQTVCMLLVP